MTDHNLTACLGKQAEDKITGIRGTITMLAQYVAGTPRVMLEAAAQDGSLREIWLDIDRVRINDEQDIEAEIKGKGLTAARITPNMIDAEIVGEEYHVFPGSSLTICCLTLKNGFTVTGESACASPGNFDAEIGRKIAWGNAREKIWPLMGFRLRDQLSA
ncbi:Gp49 family protein [Sinirhodobacter huangdaonensis]|nr:Gp49 family protein [Sinirhodobacter huangdaonensis]